MWTLCHLKGFGFIGRDDLPPSTGRGDVFLHFSDLDPRRSDPVRKISMKLAIDGFGANLGPFLRKQRDALFTCKVSSCLPIV